MRLHATETEFEIAVMSAAINLGWRVHGERPAREKDGTVTPIKGHQGWPDLAIAHPKKGIIIAELKSRTGTLGPGQREWLEAMMPHDYDGSPVLVEVWRPAEMAAVVVALTDGVHAYRLRFRDVAPPVTTDRCPTA